MAAPYTRWGEADAGVTDRVAVEALATALVATAVRTFGGDLKIIMWKIGGGGGNSFLIKHGHDLVLYAHGMQHSINTDLLAPGTPVAQGQQLFLLGNSGTSSAPHLHIHAVRIDESLPAAKLIVYVEEGILKTFGYRPIPFHGAEGMRRSLLQPGGDGNDANSFTKMAGHGVFFERFGIRTQASDPDCGGEPGTPGCECLEVVTCPGLQLDNDGCFPDGPGSFGLSHVDDNLFGDPGMYCPDHLDLEQVCGFEFVGQAPNNVATPVCVECPVPGSGQRDVPYGCPCSKDSDCKETAVSGPVSGDLNGTTIKLTCWGDSDGGWDGDGGVCLPKVNETNPNSEPADDEPVVLQSELEEFERAKWLCKVSCGDLEVSGADNHICIFNNTAIDFDRASCVENHCEGEPGPICANDGGHCGPFDECMPECSVVNNSGAGNSDCLAYGYPTTWECTTWLTPARCAPPECRDDPFQGPGDPSLCDALIYGNLSPMN